MPGRTDSRACRQGTQIWFSRKGDGRGPIRLICPSTTLKSCGSSSMLVARSLRPTHVMRGSLSILNCGPSTLFVLYMARCKLCAFWIIVRNFQQRNPRPPQPSRSWLKKAGPRDVHFTAAAARSRSGAIISKPTSATKP